MKSRTVITIVLLAFVAASVVYLIVRESAQTAPPQSNEQPPAVKNSVVVYYFHGSARCVTCRTMEKYAKEAVETSFPEALSEGLLEWRTANVQSPGNEHFISDFQLTSLSVVVERRVDGQRKEWKNLDRVWDLVRRDDRTGFVKYIRDEVQAYLEAAG